MIVLSWLKEGNFWSASAKLVGGPDDLKIPDFEAVESSYTRNKAVAYALETLAAKIKAVPDP